MRKKLMLCVMIVLYIGSIVGTASPYSTLSFPQSIRSPEQLVSWFKSDFTYEFKFPDYKQTPEDTLSRHSGDCEDFAFLSQVILNRLGIQSDVIVIKYRAINVMHAICIFKAGATYNFISNRDIVRTSGRTIVAAINEMFPDWETISYYSADGRESRIVSRKYTGSAASSTLATPAMSGMMLGPETRDIGMIRFIVENQMTVLSKSGMPFSALTFRMMFKSSPRTPVRFVFNKMQLTVAGFRVPVEMRDMHSVRVYYLFFFVRPQNGGFTAAIYRESQKSRIKQFDIIMPHTIASTKALQNRQAGIAEGSSS